MGTGTMGAGTGRELLMPAVVATYANSTQTHSHDKHFILSIDQSYDAMNHLTKAM